MFSDAALAMAVDATSKWLYNASRRLKRPFRRNFEDVLWWRLTHHLAGRLGVPLVDAARASDLLLSQSPELARVRLRSTPDDTVAISVELARFHDGASLSAAAALHLATPRRRGRPPRARGKQAPRVATGETANQSADEPTRLAQALATIRTPDGAAPVASVVQLLVSLSEASVPFVVAGGVAATFHGEGAGAESLELVAELKSRHARPIAQVLNRLGAVPRGVQVRVGFQLDSALVRSAPCLALRARGVAVNVRPAIAGIGEFPQVWEASQEATLGGASYRVLTREAVLQTAHGLARLASPA
jgi:hypothetical protein